MHIHRRLPLHLHALAVRLRRPRPAGRLVDPVDRHAERAIAIVNGTITP